MKLEGSSFSTNRKNRIILIDLLYLGDLMFATPFLKELRKNFPEARIDMVVNSVFHGLMEDSPFLDNVYSYNKKWSIRESVRFAREIAKNKYDLGLNIHGNWRTALLLKLIKPAYTIGYGGKGRGIFLDRELQPSDEKHMVDNYLDFLRELDLVVEDGYPQIGVSEEARSSIQNKLTDWGVNSEEELIALNTGGTWPTKRWTVEGFAELADELNRNYGKVIFIGSQADLERVETIVGYMDTEAIIATGRTTLKELAALLERCTLVISNDSGPVHVASAVGTPTITIFGPSDDRKYRPRGDKHRIVETRIECRPCGEHECPLGHHSCMRDISAEQILKVIREINNKSKINFYKTNILLDD
ncbi:MAG: lipopolysaccharide heptosyltransferase II [Halanaerobiales bacterium]